MSERYGGGDQTILARLFIGLLSNGIVLFLVVLAFLEWIAEKIGEILSKMLGG